MLSRGFGELKEANPELAYTVILDILSGINEYVVSNRPKTSLLGTQMLTVSRCSNSAVRHHVQTSRGLFPHKRVIRKSEMTAKGLVVTEVQEDISGLPSTSGSSSPGHSVSQTSIKSDEPSSPPRKSPIAELLYMRWLEGLKLKWPSLT